MIVSTAGTDSNHNYWRSDPGVKNTGANTCTLLPASHNQLHQEAMAILSESWSGSVPALSVDALYHFSGSCSDVKTRLVHIGPRKARVLWYTQEEYVWRYRAVVGRRL